jgi:phage tail sheath protein FI
MGEPLYPDAYIEEMTSGQDWIEGVSTTATAFLGRSARGPIRTAFEVMTFLEYTKNFGPPDPVYELGHAVRGFFENGGQRAWVVRVAESESLAEGLTALDGVKDLGLLCLPGEVDVDVLRLALAYAKGRRAFVIVDPPGLELQSAVGLARALADTDGDYGAMYYPPLHVGRAGRAARVHGSSGTAAGIYVRTELSRGVWRPASGEDAVIRKGYRPAAVLDDGQASELQAAGINCIRDLAGIGSVLWGARTLNGADPSGSDYKYVNVRRLSIFLERSIDSGTHWALFEPNDETLWAKVRATVEAFMVTLWRRGALAGLTAAEAYFVRCDRTTMTQDDIDNGRLNIVVGFAPLQPAEFVNIRIGQWTATKP